MRLRVSHSFKTDTFSQKSFGFDYFNFFCCKDVFLSFHSFFFFCFLLCLRTAIYTCFYSIYSIIHSLFQSYLHSVLFSLWCIFVFSFFYSFILFYSFFYSFFFCEWQQVTYVDRYRYSQTGYTHFFFLLRVRYIYPAFPTKAGWDKISF